MKMENQENEFNSQRESINIKNGIEDNREKWEELKKGYHYQRELILKYNEIAGFHIIIKQLREFFVSEINLPSESVFPLIANDPEAFSMYKLIDIIDDIIATEHFFSMCVRCGEKTWGKRYCYDCGSLYMFHTSYPVYNKFEKKIQPLSTEFKRLNPLMAFGSSILGIISRIQEIRSFKEWNNEYQLQFIIKITLIMEFGGGILGIIFRNQILFSLAVVGSIISIILHFYGERVFGWDPHPELTAHRRRSRMLGGSLSPADSPSHHPDIDEFKQDLSQHFPQLPEPSFWKHDKIIGLYYNKYEDGIDYTFFIDFSSNTPSLGRFNADYWLSKIGLMQKDEFVSRINDIWNRIN